MSNDISLAALWIPVMPEVSHMGEELRKAGNQARRDFESAFTGGGGADKLGSDFANKFTAAFSNKLSGSNLGGITNVLEKMNAQVDGKLAEALRNRLPEAYRAATTAANELREAQERLAHATEMVNDKTKTPTMGAYLAARKDLTQAEKDVAAATERSGAATTSYNNRLDQYTVASSKAFNMSGMFAGLLGGAVVAGLSAVTGAMEGVVHLGEHIFEGTLEAAKELSEKLIEIGEDYAQLNVQTVEFSGKTGAALTEMQEHVATVFSQLDVAGKDLGQTYAQLGSRLGMAAGPELDELARKVTELRGRFNNFKGEDLSAIFTTFKVPADQVNSALDTMVSNAQNAGVGLGDLAAALKGPAADTLSQAGLSIGQAAHFMAQVVEHGVPATSVATAFSTAMKTFGKEGVSFGDGMKEAVKELQQLGDTAAGQDLAQTLFGTRKWADAIAMAHDFSTAINSNADAFDGSAGSAQRLIDATETLENRIEALKHKIEGALEPLGERAVGVAEKALDHFSKAWDQHLTQIKGFIYTTGVTLIQLGRGVEDFAELSLRLVAPVAEVFKDLAAAVLATVASMKPLGEVLEHIPGMQGLGKAMADAGDSAGKLEGKLLDMDVSGGMNRVADWIKDHKINVNDTTDAWRNLSDAMMGAAPPSVSVGGGPGGFDWGPAGSTPGVPGGGVPGGGWGSGMPGASVAPGATTPHPMGPVAGHRANWDLIAGAESNNNWRITYGEGPDVTGGLQIATATWLSHGGGQYAPKAYLASKDQQETIADKILADPSQGARAWPTTFRQHPEWFDVAAQGRLITAGTGPTADDVPILASRGEFMVNAKAYEKYPGLVNWINAQGLAGGGAVGGVLQVIWDNPMTGSHVGEAGGQLVGPGTDQPGYYRDDWKDHMGHVHTSFGTGPNGEFYGLPKGTDIRPGSGGFPDWVYALGSQYGLQASTYAGHQEGSGYNRGIDWWPAGVQDMSGKSYTPEMLNKLQSFAQAVASAGSGKPATGGGGGVNFTADNASWGSGGQGMDASGGSAVSAMSGGGGGGGGGETQSQILEHQQAVTRANQRVGDVTGEIDSKQTELDAAKAKKAEYDKLLPLQRQAKQAEIDANDKEIERLTKDLKKLREEELPNAKSEVDIANARASEAANKPKPAHERRGRRTGEESAAESLGRGLLGGIFDSLGLPSMSQYLPDFKSPFEFASVKGALGVANWALGAMGGGGEGGSLLSGAAGPNIGKAIEAGPFTGNGPTTGTSGPQVSPYGPGRGNPPGPVADGGRGSVHTAGYVDNSQTWNINPSTDRDIVSAVSNYSHSYDHAQAKAASQSGAYQMV